MKKILTLAILLTFCMEPLAFASSDVADTASAAARVKMVQNEDPAINLDAFENNYQEAAESSAPKVVLSPIEQIFNGKDTAVSGKVLHQAGYDLFTSGSTSQTSVGKFGNSYKLSIGEKINVYTYGDSVDVMAISGASLVSPSSSTQVDSKGNIFIPGVGLVKAENRTISDVENEVNRVAAQKYKSMKIRLTVATGQEFSVFVYGQVYRPGRVLIGNNSSVFDALNAAGGVKKTGTLRNISYTSDNKTKSVDLYKTLFFGNDDGIIVRPNDKIFVGKIGDVAAIKNGVTVPAIYEILPGENIEKVVAFAGGLLPQTQVSEVTLIGFDANLKQKTAENIAWDKARSKVLRSGDSVEFRELYNNAENIVTIQGNVKHPTTYAYKDGMRLSDILKSEDELLEETFINQAVIRRISGKDNTIETIPIFLKEFFAGMNDPVLQPKDIINVYKNTNSLFVDVYGCINTPKHLTYTAGMTLNDVMTDIQFLESDVQKQDVETENKEQAETEVAYQKGAVEESSVHLAAGTANSNKLIPAERVAVEITSLSGATQVYYLYDIMINSDRIKSIQIAPEDKIFFRTLRGNEVMKTVKVSGFVKHPGVYTFVEGKRLADVIKMAGGLSKEADLRGIVFKRTNLQGKQVELAHKNNERDIKLIEGRMASAYKPTEADQQSKAEMLEMLKAEDQTIAQKYTGQIALNIKDNDVDKIKDLDNIEVQDGDDIYIPRTSNHVSIIGEVYNEQSFVYKKGANAKYYIKEVGGYTPNANKFRLYKVSVNGRAEKIRNGSNIQPGDTIVVPRKIAGNDWITPICETLKGVASIIVMAFAINKW
ncbi:SLBB domain-containing protein [bacterium]|nr:SLBB domain-containing protein [bacterium]